MAQTSSVATETLAYCTSCKMDLNHIIVAMKGDQIARVQCLTCKKEHNFRSAKGATEPKKVKTPKAKKLSASDSAESHASSIEAEWEKLMATHRDNPTKTYSVKGQFNLGDKLHHATFGDGIVGKIIYPNKLEVIFRADIKILIHAGIPYVH